jgi:hypothetical protein
MQRLPFWTSFSLPRLLFDFDPVTHSLPGADKTLLRRFTGAGLTRIVGCVPQPGMPEKQSVSESGAQQ